MSGDATRILLVEEDAVSAVATQQLLGEVADVTRVVSAEAAEELLLSRDWNVLITDVDLPGLDGLELVRQGRLGDPELVALVMSGHEQFADAVAAMRAGASDFITNPIAPQELLAKVRRAVALDRANRSRRGPTERVLAIGAHPDDIEIGCGGILLHHRDAGQAITLLTMTAGEAGGAGAVRVAEAERPAALLSARLFLLALDDTDISVGGGTVAAIFDVLDEVRPTTVYTHTAQDVHQDHRSVHHATLVAARAVPRVYAYQSPSSTVDFRPTRFVSIDDVLERKIGLIEQYASQTAIRGYLAPELLRATARYWGRFGSSTYAEPLEVVRQQDLATVAGDESSAVSPAALVGSAPALGGVS